MVIPVTIYFFIGFCILLRLFKLRDPQNAADVFVVVQTSLLWPLLIAYCIFLILRHEEEPK